MTAGILSALFNSIIYLDEVIDSGWIGEDELLFWRNDLLCHVLGTFIKWYAYS